MADNCVQQVNSLETGRAEPPAAAAAAADDNVGQWAWSDTHQSAMTDHFVQPVR